MKHLKSTPALNSAAQLALPGAKHSLKASRYYLQYQYQLPILDDESETAAIFDASPILFWTIIFVASKHLPSLQSHFQILRKKLLILLGSLMVSRHQSMHTIQALLILTMWSPSIRRLAEDIRWMYSGMILQMILQAGYHRVGYEHEYHAIASY